MFDLVCRLGKSDYSSRRLMLSESINRKWIIRASEFCVTMGKGTILPKFANSFLVKILALHCFVVVIRYIKHF